MGACPAQFFGCDMLIRHGFHNVRSGDKHIRAVFDHEDKVSHRRRINRATRRGAHDQADLRNHTRGGDIALENLTIGSKAGHALLDTRAATVVDADDGCAILHSHIHDLANFLAMGL